MGTAIYLSRAALDQIEAARRRATAHVVDAATGRCRSCDKESACAGSVDAVATLLRYGQLPVRTPGATRPERIGRGHRQDQFRWL